MSCRRVSSTHAGRGRRSRSEISSSGEDDVWVGIHQVGCRGFSGRGFDTRGRFLVGLPTSRLSGCCGFGFGLVRPGSLPGGRHFRLRWSLLDRLRRGTKIWGWSGGGLDMPPSDSVIPPFAQVHLLGRGPGSLSF